MMGREFKNGTVTYDREVNAVYVALTGSNAIVQYTHELVPGVNLYIDRDGNLVGVEVLG